MSKFVKFEDFNHTRVVTFNRPEKKNAFNEEILNHISTIIKDSEHLSNIRTIIITSVGEKIFSSGYDISSDIPLDNLKFFTLICYQPNSKRDKYKYTGKQGSYY